MTHVFFCCAVPGELVDYAKFVNTPYQAGTPVKLFFKLPYKNFKLYILINFKRKSKYLKVIKLLAFDARA